VDNVNLCTSYKVWTSTCWKWSSVCYEHKGHIQSTEN